MYPKRSSIATLSKKASAAAADLNNLFYVVHRHAHQLLNAVPAGTAVNPFTYQLPMQTLIVGRDPRFECAGSPRQLHDGSANALPGAQQCAENACSSPLRRADEFVCGASCCAREAISPIPLAIGCCIATVVATAQRAITVLAIGGTIKTV